MECTCPSQNLISDVLLCFLIPFSEIVSFVSYQKALFQYFVKSKWQELSFVRDKYIPLKREYIKSLNGRSNVQPFGVKLCIE
jgi:hypothetical protein